MCGRVHPALHTSENQRHGQGQDLAADDNPDRCHQSWANQDGRVLPWQYLPPSCRGYPSKDHEFADNFHTQWHISHHFVRQLTDDDALLMDMLWVWLPRYNGHSVELYRGENIERLESGMLGTTWISRKEKASMFASGLNTVGKGGVILQTLAPTSSIIAGPSKHSIYLGE